MEDSAAFAEALNSMFVEENRLATFDGVNWPFPKRRKCRPSNLAKAGFIYKGTSESPDNVQCFLCEKELDGWEPGDDPMKEHERHSPRCPFVTLSLMESRMATFKLWPKHLYKASPAEFAAAGFVYLPCKESPDQLRCFKCKKSLDGWEEDDDPYEEHFNHNKRCTYIKAARKRREEAAKQQQQQQQQQKREEQKQEEAEEDKAESEAAAQQEQQRQDDTQQETEESGTENDENDKRGRKQAGGKTRKKKQAGKRKGAAAQKKQAANASMSKSETETENTATEQDTSMDEAANTEEPGTVKASKTTSKRVAAKTATPSKKKKVAPLQDSTNSRDSPQQIKDKQHQQEEPKRTVDIDLEDPEIQSKTVKEFLDEVKDTMIHSIVAEAEEKIQQFRSKAAETRAQIEALLK